MDLNVSEAEGLQTCSCASMPAVGVHSSAKKDDMVLDEVVVLLIIFEY